MACSHLSFHSPSPFPPLSLSNFSFRFSSTQNLASLPDVLSYPDLPNPQFLLYQAKVFTFLCKNWLLPPHQLNPVYVIQRRNIHHFVQLVRNNVWSHSSFDSWRRKKKRAQKANPLICLKTMGMNSSFWLSERAQSWQRGLFVLEM